MKIKIKNKLVNIFKKTIQEEAKPSQLALSAAIGLYIAFSPFPGFHMLMMLFAKWILNLNLPIMFLVASINNPWTMAIFYSADYFLGYWATYQIANLIPCHIENFLNTKTLYVWSFFIGGNILGIVTALITYPLFYTLFKKFKNKQSNLKFALLKGK